MATGIAPMCESGTQAHDTIQRGVEQLLKIVDQQHLESDDQLVISLDKLRKRAASNEVTLTVLGEFSAGKTTFINSLVGTDLLHTGILPTTATCTYISYGPSAACDVVLKNGSTVSISPHDVGHFSVEGSRASEVDFVRMRLPSILLEGGLIVVDTPGVNVNIDAHEALTSQAISQSNACVYLMDARQPGKKTTIDFLRQVSRTIGKFFFVLNRSDILDAQEQQEALEYIQQVLRDECAIKNPRIALVSSTLATNEGPWRERFADFERELRSFMDQDRQLVVATQVAQMAKLVNDRAQHLLNDKWSLAERELESHYKLCLPESDELIKSLRSEITTRIESDMGAVLKGFKQCHEETTHKLRSGILEIIEGARSKEQLRASVETAIPNSFRNSTECMQSYISKHLTDTFTDTGTIVKRQIAYLLSGVRAAEERAFFSRKTPYLLSATGAVLGLIAAVLVSGGNALFSSPSWALFTISGTLAGLITARLFWTRNKRFYPPEIQLNPQMFGAHCSTGVFFGDAKPPTAAIVQGGRIGMMGIQGGHPVVAGIGFAISGVAALYGLVNKLFSPSLQKVKEDVKGKSLQAWTEFETASREEGATIIQRGYELMREDLLQAVETTVLRYDSIIQKLVESQRPITEALERHRASLARAITESKLVQHELVTSISQIRANLLGYDPSDLATPASSNWEPTAKPHKATSTKLVSAQNLSAEERHLAPRVLWAALGILSIVLAVTGVKFLPTSAATESKTVIPSAAPPVATGRNEAPTPASTPASVGGSAVLSDYDLLGFRGGQSRSAAVGHALDTGFRQIGCTDHQYDFVDCNYTRESDEKLRLGFRSDVLVIADYEAGIERYRRTKEALIAAYGTPREVPAKDGTKLSDMWGSIGEGQSLDMVERWDGTAGSLTLDYDEAKLTQSKSSDLQPPTSPATTADKLVPSDQTAVQSSLSQNDATDTSSVGPGLAAQASVQNAVTEWVGAFRTRNAAEFTALYAPNVERYFLRNNMPRERIQAAISAAFGRISEIRRYEVKDVHVEFLPDDSNPSSTNRPSRATATFNKNWETLQNDGTVFSGEEIEKLTFSQLQEGWKIVREEELTILHAERKRN